MVPNTKEDEGVTMASDYKIGGEGTTLASGAKELLEGALINSLRLNCSQGLDNTIRPDIIQWIYYAIIIKWYLKP